MSRSPSSWGWEVSDIGQRETRPLVILRAILALPISAGERLVWVALLSHAQDAGEASEETAKRLGTNEKGAFVCFPNRKTLAQKSGSESTIKRTVKCTTNTPHEVTIQNDHESQTYHLLLRVEERSRAGVAGEASNRYTLTMTRVEPTSTVVQDEPRSKVNPGSIGTPAHSDPNPGSPWPPTLVHHGPQTPQGTDHERLKRESASVDAPKPPATFDLIPPEQTGPKAKRQRKPRSQASGDIETLLDHYVTEYERANARRPVPAPKAARDLLAVCGGDLDRAKAYITRCYEPGSYWADKATLSMIAKDPDKYGRGPDAPRGQILQRGTTDWAAKAIRLGD